ncbi:alkaline phosphatase D family protein [Emcibacter sp.]|uniref:alkaline phosphatase D family protein n=1 Tax=Emcibacter sp. TaxID=1979954 RepID=UPI002AA8EEB1|nr:alkaline phosphatase D family protein [Emcibacter sp.]
MSDITRREFHLGAAATMAGVTALSTGLMTGGTALAAESQKPLSRILFGSCCHQDKPQPIWDPILKLEPELFIFLGDNIYGDTRDMSELKAKYDKQAKNFARLRDKTPTVAIWDDHDFGENDAGKDYPFRDQSKELFFDFWKEPASSPRRRDGDGIYGSYLFGPEEQRIQVILPDLRYNRDSLRTVTTREAYRERDLVGFGPYLPIKEDEKTMLGAAQWAWLEEQLQVPAKIRLIGSSLQFLSSQPGWECWSNFPHERKRIFELIEKHRAEGVIFLSGDTHWAELSCQTDNVPYPVWDLTSSGLTETWPNVSPNVYRWNDQSFAGQNFGGIYIDWEQDDPMIVMEVRDVSGNRVLQHSILLSSLSFK